MAFLFPSPAQPTAQPRGEMEDREGWANGGRYAPWRLDPCEPTSTEIILSLCSLPVEAEKSSRLEGKAAVQASGPAARTYFTKTLNGIFLLRGLRFSSCQVWVFQASTFRKEGTREGRCALARLRCGDAREREDPSCPL